MNKSNIIEINGRRYDTNTGQVIETAAQNVPASTTSEPVKIAVKQVYPTGPVPNPVAVTRSITIKSDQAKPPAANRLPHKLEQSQTLDRTAVAKPSLPVVPGQTLKISGALDIQKKGADEGPQISVPSIANRLKRANDVPKSQYITKFSNLLSHPEEKTVEKIEVRVQPPAIRPAPTYLHPPEPAKPTNPFETAVERANSHNELPPAQAKPVLSKKRVQVGIATLAVLVLGGVGLHFEANNLSIRAASFRSGISVSVPSTLPSGYHFQGPVQYSHHLVTLTFSNGPANIQISEQPNTWGSAALLGQYVSSISSSYQNISNSSVTIYNLGNNEAMWIKGNLWYQLSSNTTLPATAIQSIALST